MRKEEVIIELEKHGLKWEVFDNWMIGQTIMINDAQEYLYHEHDVKGFILEKTKGIQYPLD